MCDCDPGNLVFYSGMLFIKSVLQEWKGAHFKQPLLVSDAQPVLLKLTGQGLALLCKLAAARHLSLVLCCQLPRSFLLLLRLSQNHIHAARQHSGMQGCTLCARMEPLL